jgi:aspartate carbamoyltransferase regulatory subunit
MGANTDLNCKHCGFTTPLAPKNASEALVLEKSFNVTANQLQNQSFLNSYTKLDPTLPHLKTIACPNQACASQADISRRDILYIKTDAKNLKFQYSCTVCNTEWSS